MEAWIIYVATAVVILILGILIQERIADKKAKKPNKTSLLKSLSQ